MIDLQGNQCAFLAAFDALQSWKFQLKSVESIGEKSGFELANTIFGFGGNIAKAVATMNSELKKIEEDCVRDEN